MVTSHMAKQWKCTSCGSYTAKGVLATLRGPPEECENCGATEFETPIVRGPFDTVLDRLA
jgi:predicted nucleic-acid-binding Zn-ribbon protein